MVDIFNTEQKNSLFKLIFEKSFIHKETPMLLSSGKYSNYYFDLKQVMGDPKGMHKIAEILYKQIKQIGGIRSVGAVARVQLGCYRADPALSDHHPGRARPAIHA